MAVIVTRAGKGAPLSTVELDANFTNINTELAEKQTTTIDLPIVRPSLLLDFLHTDKLDPRVSFSRPTSGTYYDASSTALAEQNLLLRSQEFNSAPWVPVAVSVSANAGVAPDGTTTADLLYPTSSSGWFYQDSLVVNTAQVFSVYAKASGMNFLNFRIPNNAGAAAVYFDLQNGVVASGIGSIVSVGNGWYRCFAAPSSSGSAISFGPCDANGSTASTPSGTNGVLLWGAQLEQRSTVTAYTPTTTAPITNYIPRLMTAPAGVPRFDYDPITRLPKGLLVEEARTNLLTYSEDFANSIWNKVNISVNANAVVAPDGAVTADEIVSPATAFAYIRYGADQTIPAGSSAALRIFVRAGKVSSVALGLYDGSAWGTFTATILSGPGSVSIGAQVNLSGLSTTQWTLVQVVRQGGAGATTLAPWFYPRGQGQSQAGDSLYLWGAQLEAGAFATSYIPTVASAVTRAGDTTSVNDLTPWLNRAEGTVVVDVGAAQGTYPQVFEFVLDGANYLKIGKELASSLTSTNYEIKSLFNNTLNVGFTPGQSTGRIAFAYQTNNAGAAANGGSVSASSNCQFPAWNRMHLGWSQANGARHANTWIRNVAYYPKRLTNTQLQALTA